MQVEQLPIVGICASYLIQTSPFHYVTASVQRLFGTLRSTHCIQAGVYTVSFTFSSGTESLQAMNCIRILMTCGNRYPKVASASVWHSKPRTECITKAFQSTWLYTGFSAWNILLYQQEVEIATTTYLPSRLWKRAEKSGLNVAMCTHPSADRWFVFSHSEKKVVCVWLPTRSTYISAKTNAQFTKEEHAFTHFVRLYGFCDGNMQAACAYKRRVPNQRVRHRKLRSSAQILTTNNHFPLTCILVCEWFMTVYSYSSLVTNCMHQTISRKAEHRSVNQKMSVFYGT
jgi:hypothetical protein